MTFLDWLAACVLFLQLPIPIYWSVLHPLVDFWRKRPGASYIVALLVSWPPVCACVVVFRRELFSPEQPPVWRIVAGLALIVFEIWLFGRLTRDLGAARLVGKTEMIGGGSIARNGIYARLRHPRYLGSFLAMLGACLLAASAAMWMLTVVWTALMLLAILLEERELNRRFGADYEDYARQVPRFVPARKAAPR